MAAQPSGVSTTPPSLVSSANLLRVHSNSSSRLLMKKLNKTGPNALQCELVLQVQLLLTFRSIRINLVFKKMLPNHPKWPQQTGPALIRYSIFSF